MEPPLRRRRSRKVPARKRPGMWFYVIVGTVLFRAAAGLLDRALPDVEPQRHRLAAPPAFAEVEAQLAALPFQAAGPHYDLRSDVSAAAVEEALLRLEASWRTLEERWPEHAPVAGSFLINLLDDPHLYQDAWRAHWPGRPTSDGFFDEISGQAFVLHDTWDETWRLLQHEAVHQYHFSLLGPERWEDLPQWYIEGTAHDLEYGTAQEHPDAVSNLRMVQGEIADLLSLPGLMSPDWSYAADSSARQRALGFALVKFFRTTDVPEYQEWFRAFEQPGFRADRLRPDLLAAFDRPVVRDHWLRFETRLARSLRRAGTWQEQPGGLHVSPDRGHQAFLLWPTPDPGSTVTLSYRVPWPLPAGVWVGFVFGAHGVLNHRVLEWDGQTLALRLFRSGWSTRDQKALAEDPEIARADPGTVLLTLHVEPGTVRLEIEGAGTWEAPFLDEDDPSAVGLWMRAQDYQGADLLDVRYAARPSGR